MKKSFTNFLHYTFTNLKQESDCLQIAVVYVYYYQNTSDVCSSLINIFDVFSTYADYLC